MTTAKITSLNGRSYHINAPKPEALKGVYENAKASYLDNVSKISQIESLGYADPICNAFEAQGLTDDDAELALSLLKDFYQKKADLESETIAHVLSQCDDVTGRPE